MTFQDMRVYSTGLLKASFQNKTTLNKLSTSEDGNLLFDGKKINNSSVKWNQIQTEGIKIAEVTIDGMATEIFAPNGGVGSGIVIDTLIDATITTTDSYDFSASIDNYDMLLVTGMTHINSSDYEQLNSLIIMKDDYYIEAVDGWSHSLNFSISGSTRRAVFNFNNGKLNVVKIENAALKKIYGIKFITQQHNYSTEEKVVGTWVNGKPIYEKTLLFENQYLQDGFTDLDHGISDIDMYIDLKGNYQNLENSNMFLLSHLNINGFSVSIGAWCNNKTQIRISTGANMVGNYNIYMTIQYTKTTDLLKI